MALEDNVGRLRWAVNISAWNPEQREFEFLLSLLPGE